VVGSEIRQWRRGASGIKDEVRCCLGKDNGGSGQRGVLLPLARTAAVENYLEGGRRIALLLGCGAAVGEDTSTPATAEPPMAGRRQSEPYVRSQFRPPPTHVLHFAWWAVGGPDFFTSPNHLVFVLWYIYERKKILYLSELLHLEL